MEEEKRLKVEEGRFVNEATLKLLRMEIEGEVMRRFFKWIGAPLGLLGIVSIIYVLFSYIPAHLGKIMEDDLRIREAIRNSVSQYLEDEKTGMVFIRKQVETAAEKHIRDSVGKYIAGETFQVDLRENIKGQTIAYFKSAEGGQQIKNFVEAQMQSDLIKNQIRQAVETALKPATARLHDKITNNRDSLVLNLPDLDNWEQVKKADMHSLADYLETNIDRIRKSHAPVFLWVPIGNPHYHPVIFSKYYQTMKQQLGEQFRYINITDPRNRFLGLINADDFMKALSEENELLSSIRGNNVQTMKAYMNRRFGEDVEKRININSKVLSVLEDAKLWNTLKADDFLPVVDANDRLDGFTNRDKLINGLLS
jgi:CBS domain-containing protein